MVNGQQLDCHEKKRLAKYHVKDGEDYNKEDIASYQVSVLDVRNVRIHHHEPSMALARARPCRGY